MPSSTEVKVSTTPSRSWIAACAALCLAILAYGAVGSGEASDDLAYLIGYNFAPAAFMAGALHLVFSKKESTRTSWIGFALVYASLITASVITSHRQKIELRQAAAEVQKTVEAVKSSITSGSATPAPIQINNAGTTEAGKVGMVVKTMMNRMLVHRRDYELELDAIGWSKILDSQRLQSDPTMAQGRLILKQAKDIVGKYQKNTNDLFDQLKRDIESSDLSVSSKQAMQAGFDKSSQQGKAQALEIWTLEEQALAKFENILNLLSARRNGWQIQDGQVNFYRQEDLDLFNSYISQIQALVAKQEKIQTTSLQRTQETLMKLGQ